MPTDEYEDAFAHTIQGSVLTIAVADGASEAIFSREWARFLVATFAIEPPRLGHPRTRIDSLAEVWRREVNERANLPWYALEKLPDGSAATITVLQLDSENHTGKAWAIGDVCVVQIRAEKNIAVFPIAHSSHFDNRPDLITTNAPKSPFVWKETAMRWQKGDQFFVLTDAVAAWFLKEMETKQTVPRIPEEADAFAQWLAKERKTTALHNDDTTILLIES